MGLTPNANPDAKPPVVANRLRRVIFMLVALPYENSDNLGRLPGTHRLIIMPRNSSRSSKHVPRWGDALGDSRGRSKLRHYNGGGDGSRLKSGHYNWNAI